MGCVKCAPADLDSIQTAQHMQRNEDEQKLSERTRKESGGEGEGGVKTRQKEMRKRD